MVLGARLMCFPFCMGRINMEIFLHGGEWTQRESIVLHTHSQTSLSNGKLKRVCWLWWWLECGPSIRRVVIRNGILKDPRAHTHTINMARVWGDGCVDHVVVDVFSASGAEICTNKNSTIYIYVCRYYLQ